jgi:4-amino-4-deoxy-L-arabinose transferase
LKKIYLAVILIFLFLYILPLNIRPLIIPDETRYAEIPREMIATGNWISPHLDGVRYFEKPVMGYWLNALSILAFGENDFSVRLPSALAAGISALMLFLFVRRFMGRNPSALLCAGMLLICVEVFGIGTFNVLDGPLAMFLTVAMVLFYFAYQEDHIWKKRILLLLFGLFCGLAFLTKGFLALVIPVIIVVPFLIWEKRWLELWRMAWIPLATTILVVLPWALLMHQREPDFWHYFIWVEHIQRFMSSNPQHPKPFWFFIPILLIGALPWSVLFPATIQGIRKSNFKEPLFRFVSCWFFFPFLFFSASHGKLPTYILPCFPPLMIIICIGLQQYFEAGYRKLFLIATWVLAIGAAILALILLGSQTMNLFGIKMFGPAEAWKWILLAAGLLIGCLFLILAIRACPYRKALGFLGAAPILFLLSFHFGLPDQIKEHKAPIDFLRQQASRLQPDTILVADENVMSAACWVYKRQDIFLLEWSGELEYGLSYKDTSQRYIQMVHFKKMVYTETGQGRIVLIADTNFYEHFGKSMPKPIYEDHYGEFVFAQF